MRTRTAALAIASCALCAVALVAQQVAPAQVNPLASDATAVAGGRDLYGQICQSCHGPSGQGSDRGPALATTALLHGNGDADLFRSIRSGVPGTQMAGFPGRRYRYVAAGGVCAQPANLAVFNRRTPPRGDPRAGETLFFGAARWRTATK
jgi:mono/diheme cytochrome c family protein